MYLFVIVRRMGGGGVPVNGCCIKNKLKSPYAALVFGMLSRVDRKNCSIGMTVPNRGRGSGGGGDDVDTDKKILRKILLTTLCTSVDQTVTQDHLLPVSTKRPLHDMWTRIFSKDFDSALSFCITCNYVDELKVEYKRSQVCLSCWVQRWTPILR